MINTSSVSKLNAGQLRVLSKPIKNNHHPKHDLYIILGNVLDTYNIGSIFRLADAVAAKKIYLCRGSETPPNHRIKKASINTTEVVDWEYAPDTADLIKNLKFETRLPAGKGSNLQIVAIEQDSKSIPYDEFDYQFPLCLVVGNEIEGVADGILPYCDDAVEIEMAGIKNSLNVAVAFGIVAYHMSRVLKGRANVAF